MLDRLFPKTLDNRYRGQVAALWLLVPLLALRLLIGANSMINTASVASGADGIPLALFGHDAAAQIEELFALLGLAGFVMALLGVAVLVRYRAMVPLYYLLLTLLLIGGRIINALHPTARAGAQMMGSSGISVGAIVTYTLMALTLGGFVLSLIPRRTAP